MTERLTTVRLLAAAAIVACLASSRVEGQRLGSPFEIGRRVRFAATPYGRGRIIATVVRSTRDTLVLQPEQAEDSVVVPVAQLTSIEWSEGRHMRVGQGIGVGAMYGGAAGAIIGLTTYTDPCHDRPCSNDMHLTRGGAVFLGTLFFGFLGSAVGGVAGLVPAESWQRIGIEPKSVSLRSTPGDGVGLSLGIAF